MIEKNPSAPYIIKKRCLCVILVLALFVILVDVGITALLLYYINVSKQSVGEIRLNHEHTLVNGRLFVDKTLVAAKILAFNNTLHLVSQDHIYIESHDVNGKSGIIHIDKDVASIQADKITFKNSIGEDYLFVSKDNMQANIRRLNLKGNARSIPSIQAESILSSPLSNLRISSPTRNAEINSAKTLRLQSFGGRVVVESLSDIYFITTDISMYSEDIYMPNILTSRDKREYDRNIAPTAKKVQNKSYELCICGENGKLFASDDGCLTSVRKHLNGTDVNKTCS